MCGYVVQIYFMYCQVPVKFIKNITGIAYEVQVNFECGSYEIQTDFVLSCCQMYISIYSPLKRNFVGATRVHT